MKQEERSTFGVGRGIVAMNIVFFMCKFKKKQNCNTDLSIYLEMRYCSSTMNSTTTRLL